MVKSEIQTFGDEHTIEYTDIKLQCCTPETYKVLLTNVTSICLKKEKNVKEIKHYQYQRRGGRSFDMYNFNSKFI